MNTNTNSTELDLLIGEDTIDPAAILAIYTDLETLNDDVELDKNSPEYEDYLLLKELETELMKTDILIHEDHFTDYTIDTYYECGIMEEAPALVNYIDWEKLARDESTYYSAIELKGETYYYS